MLLLAAAAMAPRAPPRASVAMKGASGYRAFDLSMWYGDDIGGKDMLWVSPWAHAHQKLRAQELEIEQCDFLMSQAVEAEDYEQAQGLATRVERMKERHPIMWREVRLEDALNDSNFALAKLLQEDLEAVRTNLGLPKYNVGQTVKHRTRDIRGVVMHVDLTCAKGDEWVCDAGTTERARALGIPEDECNIEVLEQWVAQPFYTVLCDVEDLAARPPPRSLNAWTLNDFDAKTKPAVPLYLAEQHITFHAADEELSHPDLKSRLHFDSYTVHPHRGRQWRPSPRLRLWQTQQAAAAQAKMRGRRRKWLGTARDPSGWGGD